MNVIAMSSPEDNKQRHSQDPRSTAKIENLETVVSM